jgi:hypothetical protein
MITSLDPPATERGEATSPLNQRAWRSNLVAQSAAGLVVLHLGLRAYATFSSWFTGDDFAYIARMTTAGNSLPTAFKPLSGHIMPGGMYLSWLSDAISPYNWTVTATMSLLLQLVADVGMVVCLVRLFGWRPGILPPMVLAMFTSFSVPLAVWWAVGVEQIPVQIVLWWGLAALVTHLRTHRTAPLVISLLWVLFGLLFFEKAVLVVGAFAIVALAYFATGTLRQRLVTILRSYPAAVASFLVVGGGWLLLYAATAPSIPSGSGDDLFDEVVPRMVLDTFLTAAVGGPVHWQTIVVSPLPDPGKLELVICAAVVGLVVREIHRTRRRSLRAWLIPAFFLACDVVLVGWGRASLVGSQISLEPRYQGEMGAALGLALALAVMPLIGAKETVEVRARSELIDRPRAVAALSALVGLLGTVSTLTYVGHWKDHLQARDYFANLLPEIRSTDTPLALVDDTVPEFVLWAAGYPDTLLSHVLATYGSDLSFPEVATDHLSMVDGDGHVVPVQITPVRSAPPGPEPGCGYSVKDADVTIPLDSGVAYGGWWVRIGYLSSDDSPVVVTAGAQSVGTVVRPGVHALYVRGGPQFDSVTISGLSAGTSLCTNEVSVGRAVPTVPAGASEAPGPTEAP